MQQHKAIAMIPGNGWKAVYAIENETNNLETAEVIAWILFRTGNGKSWDIHAEVLDADGATVTQGGSMSSVNFLGFLAPGEDVCKFEEKAREYFEKPSRITQVKKTGI